MRKLLMTFCMMCAIFGAVAQINYLNEEERSVYLHHKKEFDARFEIARQDKYLDLTTCYVVKDEYANKLRTIIETQEARKLVFDFLFPEDQKRRYYEKAKIEKEYSDSIDRILLLSGNDISSPNMPIVFNNMIDYSIITPEQVEIFLAAAIGFKKDLVKNPRRDMWKKELELLQNTLNDEQLERFFTIKNARIAMRDAQNYWERLKEAGLTSDLDSVKAVNQVYIHKLKIMEATDIYTYDDAQKREAWAAIDQYAPTPVKRVYAINRKNTAKKQGYRGSFTW